MFGLISLLITVAIGALWMVSSMGGAEVGVAGPDGNPAKSTYQEAIDSANGVAGEMEARDAANSLESSESSVAFGKSVVVYTGISVSENTTVLDVSGRGLSGSLKAEIRLLTNLKELNMSNNNLTGIPAEVGQLSKLEVINLSNNPFTGLPHELGNLKNLRVLDLRGTNYSEQDLLVIRQSLSSSVQVLTD